MPRGYVDVMTGFYGFRPPHHSDMDHANKQSAQDDYGCAQSQGTLGVARMPT